MTRRRQGSPPGIGSKVRIKEVCAVLGCKDVIARNNKRIERRLNPTWFIFALAVTIAGLITTWEMR